MSHKCAVLLLTAGLFRTCLAAPIQVVPDKVKPAIEDAQIPPSPDQVHLTGMLGVRLDANESNRLLNVDEEILLKGFRHRPGEQAWVGEHIGKWMHAATLAWVYTGDPKLREKLDRVVAGLLKTQDPDGYLGTYLEKKKWTSWDVWVHKYDLLGLLTYYRYTGNEAALESCRKVGDLLCTTFGKDKRDIIKAGEHVGMAATSVLEPMALLYRITGEKKYLDFCEYILWAWEQPHGPKLLSSLSAGTGVNKTANGKAYEMVSNLVGLCELYRTTGQKDLLPPVLNAWKDIVDKRLYITGSASQGEHFQADYSLPNQRKAAPVETCVTVTWMQLNLQLLRLTGDSMFADQLEQTVYNHLLSAQRPTGEDWCYFTPLEGVKEYGHLGRSMNCCLSSGPRGLGLIPTFACTTDVDGVVINLYEPGTTRLRLSDDTEVTIEQRTSFPSAEEALIRVGLRAPKRFSIRLRVPEWSGEILATFGKDAPESGGSKDKGYQFQSAEWKDGDQISVRFKMPLRVIEGHHTNEGKVALARGPLVLGATDAGNPQAGAIKDVALPDEAEALKFTALPTPTSQAARHGGGLWEVSACRPAAQGTAQAFKLHVLPFAEAGYDGSYYQVWFNKGCVEGEKVTK